MKRNLIVRHSRQVALAFCGLLMGAMSLQSCQDEDAILTGQPEWLGNSIYERLNNDPDGQKYTYLLRLIDDLGQKEILNHTGSRTLFAADDAAFERWFKNNSWKVDSYEKLTKAQKTMLLNTSMVTNAYLIELMSNKAGNPPTKGGSMRRLTASSILDSVPLLDTSTMPDNNAWKYYKSQDAKILTVCDATAPTIIHLLPEFMKVKSFTSEDVDILTNHASNSVNESFVNGVMVTKQNITCKNGYIHKIAEVMMPLSNMAQIIRDNKDEMGRFSHLLDRFSAPYFNRTVMDDYNTKYNLNTSKKDSVFVLRYLSNRTSGSTDARSVALEYLPDGKTTMKGSLTFDPGWNQYYPNSSGYDYHDDAGAMFVPSTAGLDKWWNEGAGKPLREQYGTWDGLPDDIVADLINNNMMSSFVSSIPSNFDNIVDDAMMPMHVQTKDVKKTYLASNGVVYLTDSVYAPSSFSSVVFPAQIHKDVLNIFYWAIEKLDGGAFKSLLSSMEATYSLLMPANTSMLTYVDPTLYGANTMNLYQFYYDNDSTISPDERVKAKRYNMENKGGQWTCKSYESTTAFNSTIIKNRMKDMLNSMIIVGELNPSQEYYRTRAGSTVRVLNPNTTSMTVAGGYQLEGHNTILGPDGAEILNNDPCPVTKTPYNQKNGKSYQLDQSMPMSSTQSVGSILSNTAKYPEFKDFYDLLSPAGLFTSSLKGNYTDETGASTSVDAQPNAGHQNLSLLDGYHYTVYVPKAKYIQALQAKGYLPSPADFSGAIVAKYGNATNVAIAKRIMKQRMADFVKYHVQDNSLFIAGEPVTQRAYESSMINTSNNRFYSLQVTADNSGLNVWGQYWVDENCIPYQGIDDDGFAIAGQSVSVDKASGCYNLMAREFWNSSTKSGNAALADENKQIYSTSDAVVHLIDGALIFSKNQLTSWFDEVYNADGFDKAAYDAKNPGSSRKR